MRKLTKLEKYVELAMEYLAPLLNENRIFEIQCEQFSGGKAITLSGMYRIGLGDDNSVSFATFNPSSKIWVDSEHQMIRDLWPDNTLRIDYRNSLSNSAERYMKSVIRMMLVFASCHIDGRRDGTTKRRVELNTLSDFIFQDLAYRGLELDLKAIEFFFATLKQSLVFPRVLGLASKVYPYNLTLKNYLVCFLHRFELSKAAQQDSELLPLLVTIDPFQWGRQGIFSSDLWIKPNGRDAKISKRPLKLKCGYGFAVIPPSIPNESVWIKLCSTKADVIDALVETFYGRLDENTMSVLEIGASYSAPGSSYRVLATPLRRFGFSFMDSPLCSILLHSYFREISHIHRKSGEQGVYHWLDSNPNTLSDLADYLVAAGSKHLTDQKPILFKDLLLHSRQWHNSLSKNELVNFEGTPGTISWKSLLDLEVIDGVKFEPITGDFRLHIESKKMKHCAQDYTWLCYRGLFRFFAVTAQDGSQSTLVLAFEGGRCEIHQHVGYRNSSVIQENALIAGRKLAQRYASAFAKRTHCADRKDYFYHE